MIRITLCCVLAVLVSACKRTEPVGEDASCQGQGIEEFISVAPGMMESGARSSYKMYIVCSGLCPDGTPCDTIFRQMILPSGKRTRIWCGCKGDQAPRTCDVIMEHVDTVTRFVCTPLLEGCPAKGDSCIATFRTVKDTIRSLRTGADSLYRTRKISACECLNRGPV